jgi:hypothetical protein
MASSGMLRRVVLVRTDVSEELSVSFIRVTRIGELGTTLAVTSTPTQSAWDRWSDGNKSRSEEWCLLGSYAVWLL